jgi:hypothetical protein
MIVTEKSLGKKRLANPPGLVTRMEVLWCKPELTEGISGKSRDRRMPPAVKQLTSQSKQMQICSKDHRVGLHLNAWFFCEPKED